MPITDLTGTTWTFNNVITSGINLSQKYITFITADTHSSTWGRISYTASNTVLLYKESIGDWSTVYNKNGWMASGYETITISGGTDVTNADLIAWLEANATQVLPHDVAIFYNNAIIATMDESGTKTLQTEGKYCDGNIEVEYTEPTPSLQNKTVSPATTSQSVTADSGYDGLGTVTVNAISPTKAAQTYTPTTTNQTISSGRWLTGAQTILGDANLVAGNIKKDVSIFNVTGTYEGSGGGGGGDLAGLIQRTITSASDSTVTKIGMCAFYSCYSLVTISFPNCSLIESSAFYTCSSLIAASFPKCQSIGQAAFSSCHSLGLAYFPSCSWVGSCAFRWCSQLSEISFPLCSVLHNYAFDSCAITTASFPACTLLNSAVFYVCSHLSSIYFPICTTVGSQAFRSCAITTAFFPECRFISASAFGVCKELVVASFPRCSRIYSYAFQSCFHLLSLYLLGTSVPTLSLNVFASTPIFNYTASTGGVYGSIFVKASLLASFQTAKNWSVLSARMVGLTDEQIAAL